MANIRYFVSDIEEAITFYTQKLGFSMEAKEANFGPFRNEIISGVGRLQILAEDPSGNPIELNQPA